jgi:hypothetical protein
MVMFTFMCDPYGVIAWTLGRNERLRGGWPTRFLRAAPPMLKKTA